MLCIAPSVCETVALRLEQAGRTLLSANFGSAGPATRQTAWPAVPRRWQLNYNTTALAMRPPVPTAAEIAAMDQAFRMVALVPDDKRVLRRIVLARSLVNPLNDRHLFSWRRLARTVGADHHAVQRWHRYMIRLIALA